MMAVMLVAREFVAPLALSNSSGTPLWFLQEKLELPSSLQGWLANCSQAAHKRIALSALSRRTSSMPLA
jgi:hypothetical protein